jgi:thioredoxin reductase
MTGVDVAVVGGGPAGLSAAIALRKQGAGSVVVIERENEAGGVPRHTDHLGFGVRELHRLMRGPTYAAGLVARAVAEGVELRTATTVTDWSGPLSLDIVDETGSSSIDARAVVLATGVRERPRSARLVPGDRGAGVFTTGSLQRWTAVHHQPVGRQAVVVGAEHVSFSAVRTLQRAGTNVVAIVTSLPHHQSYWPLRVVTATRHRVPLLVDTDIAEIHGLRRVDGVTLTDGRRLECDTVVFTGDWIPEHEIARRGRVGIDPVHRGPVIDAGGRTDRTGVFAVGNLVHPAETAHACAVAGTQVTTSVIDWLNTNEWPSASMRVRVDPPLLWVAPSVLRPAGLASRSVRFVLRVGEFVATRTIAVTQEGRTLWHGNVLGRHLAPNRSISIAGDWIDDVDPAGEDIVIAVQD